MFSLRYSPWFTGIVDKLTARRVWWISLASSRLLYLGKASYGLQNVRTRLFSQHVQKQASLLTVPQLAANR